MKTQLKNLLALCVLSVACRVAPPVLYAAEQTHDFGITSPMGTNLTFTQSSTVTNTVGTNTVISLAISNPVAPLALWKNSVLMFSFIPLANTNAMTTNITATFARSIDGTAVETIPRFTVTAALNGTNQVALFSNLTAFTEGGSDMQLISLFNTDTHAVLTNVTLKLRGQRDR